VVVGHENRRFSKKEKRFEKRNAKSRMVLNGDIGFGFKTVSARYEVRREHQEPDIVKERGKIQMVQLAWSEADRLTDQQGNCSRATAVTRLPGQRAIDFLADLANEDGFDVAA
jgi:hypothetical protein